MLSFLLILLAAALLFLLMLSPSRRRRQMLAWRGHCFAHRGLHGSGVCENTLAAFERACSTGVGIELDVQLSLDDVPVVFHDDDLSRLFGDERRVDQLSYAQLQALILPGGGHIPSFSQVLSCISGRVPLLVEIKNGRHNSELCRKCIHLLSSYAGPFLVESFNPLILLHFRRSAPEMLRGQLVTSPAQYRPQQGLCTAILLANLSLNFLARPDFISYDISCSTTAIALQRRLFRTPLACWTVKDSSRLHQAVEAGEMPIFEGFQPE